MASGPMGRIARRQGRDARGRRTGDGITGDRRDRGVEPWRTSAGSVGHPLHVLPAIAEAVGDRVEVFVDGGVRSGADVVAAVGLGARAVLIGRAYLYGLMAGGERGVARAISILRDDVVRAMQLLGVRSIMEVDASMVSLGT